VVVTADTPPSVARLSQESGHLPCKYARVAALRELVIEAAISEPATST